MKQLEDLFIQNFNVISETLVDNSNGQPINAWKFEDGPSKPFFKTPEFVGYIDSALFHLTEEFSEVCTCEYDPESIDNVLNVLHESQISKRITELFGEEVAVEMVDHMFKYSSELRDKTTYIQMEATKLLQPLMIANNVSSVGFDIQFGCEKNYNLKEDDPILSAISFAYGYQLGWDVFERVYENVKVLNPERFAKKIIETYFAEPERSLPFMHPDLMSKVSELPVVDTED